MSLETDVANLVTKTESLISYFNTKKAGIDTALAAALAAVPSQIRTYYVDPVAGLDTNEGNKQEAPLKTIEKAVEMTPAGGILTVVLMNDYTHRGTLSTNKQLLHIKSLISTVKVKLNIPYYEQEGTTRLPGISFATGGIIMLTDITLTFPSPAGLAAPQSFYNSFFKTGSVAGIPLISVKLSRCDIVSAADGTGSLFTRLYSAVCLMVTETTFPAGFGGRYISGVASGSDPKAYADIITNVSTL